MKRIAFAVAILAAVACSAQDEPEMIDVEVDPAAAPAPEIPMDSTVIDSIVPPVEETPEG